MEQNITSATTKGVVIALILIILELATYFANIEINGPARWLAFAVFIGGIIWAVYSYGKQLNYNSTFGNYFAHGFKVAALITAIMIIYIIIFIILFPDFKEKALDEARIAMRKNNKLTEAEMTQAMELSRKFFMIALVGATLLRYIIAGALCALIGAAVTKKQPGKFVGDINQTAT